MMKNSKRPTATRSSYHPEPEGAESNTLTDPGGQRPANGGTHTPPAQQGGSQGINAPPLTPSAH